MGLTSSRSEKSSTASAQGELFIWQNDFGYPAFEVGGRRQGSKALVCIPGLTDGLLSLRYMPALGEAAWAHGWRTFQPILSSSYSGWAYGSLASDVEEMDRFLEFLEKERGITEVTLLGHSTGCQDVVHFLKTAKQKSKVVGAILQAGLSDREALLAGDGTDPNEVKKFIQLAEEMLGDGRGDEMMPRAASLLLGPPHPVTAYRFHSLTGRMTDDDMFSTDLSDNELQLRLGHIAIPTLLCLSADDEYAPSFLDPQSHSQRMADAMAAGPAGLVQHLVIEEGGHSLRKGNGSAVFIEAAATLLGSVNAAGRQIQGLAWQRCEAEKIKELAANMPSGRPLLVALAGMPGSGKSTASASLSRLFGPECLIVPMDGYHLPLADLKKRADATEAVYRRGAPDTFDPASLKAQIAEIREPSGSSNIALPGFDHSVGDPAPGAVKFDRKQHRIVIVEGLYLLHSSDGWEGTAELFDHRLYLEADLEACIARVKERNKCIPGYTPEEIDVRCEAVDRKNALTVQQSAALADVIVKSGAD